MNDNDKMEIMRHMLIERIEKKVGRSMRTPRDFDFLSMRIFYDTGMQISVSTLKRTWGYVGKNNAMARRETTLNILARFVGYMDWGTFCKHSNAGGEIESDFVMGIIESEHRQPTFEDAIKYGMRLQKERLLAKVVDGEDSLTLDGVITFDYYDGDKEYGCVAHDSFCLEDWRLKDMDKVKILILKK
jgi:hypothetical protein